MATYFHGGQEIQSDGLQTLYLMNPSFEGYSDAPAPANMVFMNSANSLNPMSISQNFQSNQQKHLVGIPIQPMAPSYDSSRAAATGSAATSQQVTAVHGLSPRLHYNLWTPATPSSSTIDFRSPPPPQQMWRHRPSPVVAPQQGLSLSLSPQQTPYEVQATAMREAKALGPSSVAEISNGIQGLHNVLMGSKYLKAAQLLLDEVVGVGNETKVPDTKSRMKSSKESGGAAEGDTSANRGGDLTIAERQELQMKKGKLVGMMDEVEQRYRHYRHQMEMVVSSFEAVAGFGAARTYTALALKTISKQFQCLREAISGQIQASSKSLGEESGKSTCSRLRFVDHQLRQQRALQQLGMIQHNAWRPQRGLPERAVSVLRAWLFEHFLHPYPKDADKHMLAKQTGLTRSQVSNWFINARVRLWKPMVEQMYSEEFKDQELNNADEKASPSDVNEESASKSDRSPTRTEQTESENNPNDPRAAPISPTAITSTIYGITENQEATMMQPSLKKTRSDQSIEMKPEMSNRDFLMEFMDGGNRGGGYGDYSIGEVGRFAREQFTPRFTGKGVSLTLGLPHSSGAQPSYLTNESIPMGRTVDMSTDSDDYCSHNDNQPIPSHPPSAYDHNINIQSRKRFSYYQTL